MYNSEQGQTDDSPFITASGERVREGGVACPVRFDFGTEVLINGNTYICNDRLNAKYQAGDYFDIWSSSKQQALQFGRRQLQVQIQ